MNIIEKPMTFDQEIKNIIRLFVQRRKYWISYIRGARENLWLVTYPPKPGNADLIEHFRYKLKYARYLRSICDQNINLLRPYLFCEKQKDKKLISDMKIDLNKIGAERIP